MIGTVTELNGKTFKSKSARTGWCTERVDTSLKHSESRCKGFNPTKHFMFQTGFERLARLLGWTTSTCEGLLMSEGQALVPQRRQDGKETKKKHPDLFVTAPQFHTPVMLDFYNIDILVAGNHEVKMANANDIPNLYKGFVRKNQTKPEET